VARRSQPQAARSQSNVTALAVLAVLFVGSFLTMIYFIVQANTMDSQIYSGYTPTQDGSRYEQIEPGAKGYIALLTEKDKQISDYIRENETYKEKVGIESVEELDNKFEELKNDIRLIDAREIGENFVGYLYQQAIEIDSLRQQLQTVSDNRDSLEDKLKQEIEAAKQTKKVHDAQLEELDAQKRARESEQREEVARLEKLAGELRDRITELEGQITAMINEHRTALAALTRERDVARNALAEVQQAKGGHTDFNVDTAEPDGVVLKVNRLDKSCMVDIGTRHGAKAGLQFVVYETGAGGVRREKATIELKKVDESISYAGVVEIKDPLDPILENDIIISPLFKRGRANVFVFENDIDRFEQASLKDKIEQFGNRVANKVTAETDFVVIKSSPGDVANDAKRWAVQTIRIADLAKVLGE